MFKFILTSAFAIGFALWTTASTFATSTLPDVATFEKTRVLPFTSEANFMSYGGYWRHRFYEIKGYWPEKEIPIKQRIRYGGLYVAKNAGEDYLDYLKFYADGTVVSVVSTGTPQQIIRFLHKRTEFQGQFVNLNGTVIFALHGSHGDISYIGEVSGDKMKLESHSHMNGYEITRFYDFVRP